MQSPLNLNSCSPASPFQCHCEIYCSSWALPSCRRCNDLVASYGFHQHGQKLEHFKLRIFRLLPPDLKKPHRNMVPATNSLEENNNILCLFFLTIFRISRSMDYHHPWLLVRKIIYNKYCSCLQQTYNVYSSFINTALSMTK